MFLKEQLELSKYSLFLSEAVEVTKTHLFINLDRAEYCFDLAYEYRWEKLRRQFEKYTLNRDALFEWYPDDALAGILGCDFTGYLWQFGDPGIWLAGKYLAHIDAVPVREQVTQHLAFRSTREIETIFYAFIDHSFLLRQVKRNYKKIKTSKNRLDDLLQKFENRQPLI
ncbi:MAG: hypothetical protein KF846_11695 [Cyclobacteriaceae bacterium]|nr:hypothetical protein [Cyclobacteriaceae bacterium]